MQFTDFQKDCLVKAKNYLNLIPKTENNVIRWNLFPGKVAIIIDLLEQSKLSAQTFADNLLVTASVLNKFKRGKNSKNEPWPELQVLQNPEKALEKKLKKEKEKADKAVENEIFKILLRDQVKEIGLRTETIQAEIKSYPSRFVATILGRLAKSGRLIKFVGSDKFTKWKVVEKVKEVMIGKIIMEDTIKEELKDLDKDLISSTVTEKLNEMVIKPVIHPEYIDQSSYPCDSYEVPKSINIPENYIITIENGFVTCRIPITLTNLNFPFGEWEETLEKIQINCPKLAPWFLRYFEFQSPDYSDRYGMLINIRQAMKSLSLPTEHSVMDHFKNILSLSGIV